METTTQISVSEGDSTFTLPSAFKEEVNPEMSDTAGTGYRRMKKILKNGIEARDTDDEGRPLLYRIWQKQGYLYAKADGAYTFPLEYYQWLGPIESDTAPGGKTGELLDKIYEFIEERAIAAGFRRLKQWNAANQWDKKAEERLYELTMDEEAAEEANLDLQMEMPG